MDSRWTVPLDAGIELLESGPTAAGLERSPNHVTPAGGAGAVTQQQGAQIAVNIR